MIDISNVLKTVIYYNGYEQLLREWAQVERKNAYMLFRPHLDCSIYTEGKLEIIWMILVVMFGDWGTSPRSGWITNVSGFRDFLNEITSNDGGGDIWTT